MEAFIVLSPAAAVIGAIFIILGLEMKEAALKQTGYVFVAFAVITAATLLT